jgi:serine protease
MTRTSTRIALLAALVAVASLVSLAHFRGAERNVTAGNPAAHAVSRAHSNGLRVSRTQLGLPPLSARAQRRTDGGFGPGATRPRPGSHEDEDVQYAENSNRYSTRPLTYRGGAVQTSPRIYLVFWGSSWTTNGDPYGVANTLHYMYSGLSGSSWANVLTQYTSNYGRFLNGAGQYRGWLRDTTPVPLRPTQADLVNAVARAAARVNDYNYNAQYVIATPWGVVDQSSLAHSWCAFHNWTNLGSSWVTYTSLPYTPYMDTIMPTGCGGRRVNGANGILDGVTINAGHEYAETVNDPGLNAYLDSDGAENGDKCSWLNLANRTLANGYVFPMQPTWSNSWRNLYGDGCRFS